MKIVNANEFLEMPKGTLYSVFENMQFWEFCIKGRSWGDVYEWSKVLTQIAAQNAEDFNEKLSNFEGKSFELTFDNWAMNTINDNEKFAIYEKEDIQKLIELLKSITW